MCDNNKINVSCLSHQTFMLFTLRCVDDGDTSLEDVQIANLSRSKIYDIPASFLQLRNLTVCLLGNNRIMSINSILCCKHLVKLDLHGNQVSMYNSSKHCSKFVMFIFPCAERSYFKMQFFLIKYARKQFEIYIITKLSLNVFMLCVN